MPEWHVEYKKEKRRFIILFSLLTFLLKIMEPPIGFEPMTYGLQDRRSTSWAMVAREGLYRNWLNCKFYFFFFIRENASSIIALAVARGPAPGPVML